jgi:hypothetical protein
VPNLIEGPHQEGGGSHPSLLTGTGGAPEKPFENVMPGHSLRLDFRANWTWQKQAALGKTKQLHK